MPPEQEVIGSNPVGRTRLKSMKFSFRILFLSTIIFGINKKEQLIIDFIESRYSGDTIFVNNMISDNFIYHHTPYSGLNITTSYEEGDLIVTGFVSPIDSLTNKFNIGDKIHEINGKKINLITLPIQGPIGKNIHIISTKKGDSVFTEDSVKLELIQYSQNKKSFIQDIIKYDQMWYNFDFEVINIFSKKNQIFIYYYWEGSKSENSHIYHFYSMEIIKRDKSSGLIHSIEGLWSEKQFRDQFK